MSRPAWIVGALALVAGACIMGLSGHHFQGDAILYRVVARNPFANGAALKAGAANHGVAYRYGRVGYPLAAWLRALGRARFVGWTMGVVSLASYAGAAALGAELCARRGRRPSWGLIVLGASVMTISMGILFAEPFVIALILLTYLLWIGGHHRAAFVVGATIPLVREVAVVALLPLVLDAIRRRDRPEIAGLAMTTVPYGSWALVLRVHIRQWPFFDHSTSGRGGLGLPLAGFARTLNPVLIVLALGTVLAAAWLHHRQPWPPVTLGALLFALLIPFLGSEVLRYCCDSFRIMGAAHVLILLALAGRFAPTNSRSV